MKQLSEKSKQIVDRLSAAKNRKEAIKLLPILRKEGFNQYTIRYYYEKIWRKTVFKRKILYINGKNKEYALDKKSKNIR